MPLTLHGAEQSGSLPRLDPGQRLDRTLLTWWRAHPTYRTGTVWPDLLGRQPVLLRQMAVHSAASGWRATQRRGGQFEVGFDGVGAYGDASTNTAFDFANMTFTASLWFRATGPAGTQQYLLSKRSGAAGGAGWFLRVETDGTLGISLDNASANVVFFASPTAVADGAWHHAVGVYTTDTATGSANACTLYLDGALVQSASGGTEVYEAPSAGTLLLGMRNDSSRFLQGSLDDLRLWTRGLSAREVTDLYQRAPQERVPAALQRRVPLWWPLPTGTQTLTLAPAQRPWQAQRVTLFTPPTGATPAGVQDIETYRLGDVLTLYLQTLNPDTGAAWPADAPPQYQIYVDGGTTARTTGSYVAADLNAAPGFYAAQLVLDGTLGFEAGRRYSVRSSWTIVGASEAELADFTISRGAVSLTPARLQWAAQAAVGRALRLQPARVAWQPRTPQTPRVLRLTPARAMWGGQGILGARRAVGPGQWRWRGAAVPQRPDLRVAPARGRWQPQGVQITLPFPAGAPLPALAGAFVAGDWLVQSARLQLKLSLTYAPDATWEHRLVALGDVEVTVPPGGGLATVANLTFTAAEDGQGQSLLQRWRRLATIGGAVDITLDFRTADGLLVRVFTGVIDTIRLRNGLSEVLCVDQSVQRNLQLPQTLLTSNLYPLAASAALAQPLPLVYGYGSHLHAVPLLLTNTSALGYTAAAHGMSMTSQVAVFNAEAQRFMPGAVAGLRQDTTATLFVSTPLQQQLLNAQTGAMALLAQQNAIFPEAAIDANAQTLARVYATTLAPNGDGTGLLTVYARPTSDQRGNNQAVITLTNHRRAPTSDPTMTGQFTVETIDAATGAVLRSALFTTTVFRQALTPLTTTQTLPNLALGAQEAVAVVLQARNEGGVGGTSGYYEVEDIQVQTGYIPGGDQFPIFLTGDFNGRVDATGTVTPQGARTLYTLPNHVIGSLLTDELGLPLADTVLAANTTYLVRNYTFAGGVGYGYFVTRAAARQLLGDAAWQAAAILAPDTTGRWGLRPFDASVQAALALDPSTILCEAGAADATGSDATEVTLGNMEWVHCRFEVHYAWNAGAQKFDQVLYAYESGTNAPGRDDLRHRCQLSALRYGITEPLVVQAYWISTGAAALALLDHLVTYFSFQRITVTLQTTLRALTVRLGDFLLVTHPLLPEGDNGGAFEVHAIRVQPMAGRITLTASKRAVVYVEYFTIRDQAGVLWYWWFDEAGQLVRDLHAPHVEPLTSLDVTGEPTAPYWHRVQADDGTVWYLYPDVLGQLVIDTVPPALGTGMDTGAGLTAIAFNAQRYRLGAAGTPEGPLLAAAAP